MRRISINEDRCKSCELCVSVCPRNLVTISTGTNSRGFRPATLTDQEKCISCALCARICPDCAITVWKDGEAL